MNDDNFIDNALKEHARLEGNPDQDFLDQLEAKLDEQSPAEAEEKKTSRFPIYGSVAAALVVSLVGGAVFFNQSRPEDLAVNEEKELVGLGLQVEPEEEKKFSRMKKDARSDSLPSESDSLLLKPRPAEPQKPRMTGMAAPVSEVKREAVTANRYANYQPQGFKAVNKPGTQLEESATGGRGDTTRGAQTISPQPLRKIVAAKAVPVPGGFTAGRQRLLADRFGDLERSSSEKYGALVDQGFLSSLSSPLSTFSIDVDTASYTNIRRHIVNGQSIHPDAVRIEEMINYFDYNYAQPEGPHPFAVHTEVASCPWNTRHRLVKIGLQGKQIEAGQRKAANLVFLIDVSGSMNSSDKLPLLVQSFQILLKELNENDRVSLVVYAGRQAVLLDPTAIDNDGREVVSRALQNLSAGGSTHGSAGIKTAYELARKSFIKDGVNRVILATDGDFNVGTTNSEALVKLVKNQAEGNISLTILGFGRGNLNDNLMEKLTNKGDGNYFYLDSLREGQKVFKTGLTGTIETIAKDVKIQVEFNPGKVAQYRLIGYANRRLRDKDFANDKIDAGDIGAGHRVTALYEVVPVGVKSNVVSTDLKYQKVEKSVEKTVIVDSPEMLTVKLRYKQPDGDQSTLLSQALTDQNGQWKQASEDFRFASSVALWGMLLRNSEHAGSGAPELATQLALDGKGDDVKGQRTEMLDLIRRWSSRK